VRGEGRYADHDDKDKEFAFGLECVLDGIAAQITKRQRAGSERPGDTDQPPE
jgi:hypothetical protein